MAVEFAVELDDKLSGPATEAAKGLDALVASFDKLKESASAIDVVLSKLPATTASVVEAVSAVDAVLSKLPATAKAVSESVSAFDEVAASVAKVEQASAPAAAAATKVTDGITESGDRAVKSLQDIDKELLAITIAEKKAIRAGAGESVVKGLSEKRKSLGLDKEIHMLQDKQRKSMVGVTEAGSGLPSLLGQITSQLLAAGRAAAGLAIQFGKAVYQASTLKSESIRGLAAVLGDEQQAKAFGGSLVGFKGADSFDPGALYGAGRSLVGAGFSTSQAEVLVKAVADAASVSGNDNAMIGQLADSFGEVQSKGKLDLGKLLEISKASKYAINADQVTNKIAEIMGTTADEARKALEKGQVGAQEGLAGIVAALRDRVGGGIVGGAAAKGADTLPGLVAQVQAKMFNLTKTTEDTPGLMKLQTGLKNVVDLLDAATPRGKRLQTAFDTMVDGLFGKLLGGGDATATVDKLLTAFEGIAAAVGPIVSVMSGIGEGLFDGFMDILGPLFGMLSDIQGVKPDWMDGIVGAFKTLGKVVGWVAGFLVLGTITIVSAVAAMVAFVGSQVDKFIADWHGAGAEVSAAWDWIVGIFDAGVDLVASVGSKLLGIGKDIVAGLWTGIKSAWGGFLKDFSGLVDMLPTAVKKVLGIASPAKVMMPLGGFAVEGIGVGATRAAPALRRRMEDVVTPLATITMPTMLRERVAGRGAAAPSVTINVNAAGATREDADTIAERVRAAVLEVFRESALMAGAT